MMTRYICRCEDVTLERVETVIAEGKSTLNDVKRHTRVGMGRCQGVYCLAEVRHLLGETGLDPMTQRPPARQIRLDTLAATVAPSEDD
jgi:bacterioferritin-associated ferredoxin